MKFKISNIALISTFIIFSILITPIALAKTRESYLTDFIFEKQKDDEMFGATYQDTAYALEIIDYYNLYQIPGLFGSEIKINIPDFRDNLESAISTIFSSEEIILYDLYYLIESLDSLDTSINSLLKTKISRYINETEQMNGGFSSDNSTSTADMISTFFAFEIKEYLNEQINNQTLHQDWILSCNNTDGGYGGNETLSSSLLTSYLAVHLIEKIGDLNQLENRTATLNYFKSFYVGDSNDLYNYGGYLPDIFSENTLFSSTFYCVSAINILNAAEVNKLPTVNWVLNHQNFEDGGFSNFFGGTVQGLSSIQASYYAFKVLMNFNELGLLNEEIFMVEFNFIILLVVIVAIAAVIALLFFIWRKRKI